MGKHAEKINLLDTVPVRSGHVETEYDEGGYAILAFPRFKQAWMRRLCKGPLSFTTRVQLEEHGTAVWQLIDGKRTVGEIIALLAAHFEGKDNYATRVALYLMRMHKDGLIRLIGK